MGIRAFSFRIPNSQSSFSLPPAPAGLFSCCLFSYFARNRRRPPPWPAFSPAVPPSAGPALRPAAAVAAAAAAAAAVDRAAPAVSGPARRLPSGPASCRPEVRRLSVSAGLPASAAPLPAASSLRRCAVLRLRADLRRCGALLLPSSLFAASRMFATSFYLVVHFVLIGQTAQQPAAHAGDLGRVQHHLLFLGHADRHGLEIAEEGGAAAQLPCRRNHSLQ